MSNFAGNKIIDEPITKRIFDYTSYIIKETNNNKL
jgi:hypothetical protein